MIPTTGSPNIATLECQVLMDISDVPTIKLTNQSTGLHLDLCKWWIVITTPSGTPIHSGSFGVPDLIGNWTTWVMPEIWPQPFGEIEWSGYNYTIVLNVSDGQMAPLQFNITKQPVICRPNGNTAAQKNNFAPVTISKTIQCTAAKVLAQDLTNYMYKDSVGSTILQQWRMVYPPDQNGNQSDPYTLSNIPYAYFPITYNADGYNIYLKSIKQYSLGDNCFVRILYIGSVRFNVQCNVDLCQLVCAYDQLIAKVQKGQCSGQSTDDFKQNLLIINGKVNIILMAEMQGCTNADVEALIADINKLGDFDCGCSGSSAGSGIIPQPPPPSSPCCPITVGVNTHGTGVPPVECPNSFFPASVFAPDGMTFIGMAYSSADMISIINANDLWQAQGTAINEGNCKVGIIPATGITDPPPVVVWPGTGTGSGSGGSGSGPDGGGAGSGCVNGQQHYLAVLTDKCNGNPINALPCNVWVDYGDGGGVHALGPVATVAALLVLLNAQAGKPASVSYTAGSIPGQLSILVTNTNCTAFSTPIYLTGDLYCNPIIITVVDPNGDPEDCASSYFPANIYEPDGTTLIGVASDINSLIGLMNGDAEWNLLGVASYYSLCQVSFTKNPGITVVPNVVVDPNGGGGGTGCVDGMQSYVITLGDQCDSTHVVTPVDFPFNLSVVFNPGVTISVGSVSDMTSLLTALNTTPAKPASVTFSAGTFGPTDPISIVVTNTNCTAYSNVIWMFTDAASNSYLLYGSNHGAFLNSDSSGSGQDAFGLRTQSYIGRIPGLSVDARMWHTIKIGNYMVSTRTTNGNVLFWDMTNPLSPVLARTIALNDITGTCFTGEPQSGGQKNYYSLYFPTDTEDLNMSLNEIYVSETVTGCIWKIDFMGSGTGVIDSFQDDRLIGKCPRILVNRILHFTQDGDLETTSGQSSGVTAGNAVYLAVDTFDGTGISVKTIITGGNEPVWAATYDGVDTIWYVGQSGTLVNYSVAGAAVVLPRYVNLMAGKALTRLNAKIYYRHLYLSAAGGYMSPAYPNTGTILFDLSTLGGLNTIIPFHPFSSPSGGANNTKHFMFKLLNGCVGILTYENAGNPGGVAHFGGDGTFNSLIPLTTKGSIYNVIAIPNINVYSPTTLV